MGTISLLASEWETKREAGGSCASAPFPACRLGTWDVTWELPTHCCVAFSSPLGRSVVLQLPEGVEQEQLCRWGVMGLHLGVPASLWHQVLVQIDIGKEVFKKTQEKLMQKPLAACITATWITQVSLRPLCYTWCLWHLGSFAPSKLTQNQTRPSIKPDRFMIRRRLVHFLLSKRNRHINIFCADSLPCGNSPGWKTQCSAGSGPQLDPSLFRHIFTPPFSGW